MKIYLTLKDPDALLEAIDEAFADFTMDGLTEEELEHLKEKRKEDIYDKATEWFEYGEYFVLCYDSEKNTCEVLKPTDPYFSNK